MWDMHGGGGWWMLFGGILVFAVLGLLVWLVTRLANGRSLRIDEPIDIARRRYATGEITRDQLDQIRQDLGASYGGEGRTAIGRRGDEQAWLLPLLVVALLVVTTLVVLAAGGAFRDDQNGWGFMNRMMGGGMMGYGRSTADAPQTTGGQSEAVSIRDFAFTPGNLQVPVGATVTWTNYDDAPHTATAADRSWDTGILNKGQHRSLTFDKAGDYTYYCTVHPSMQARLVVR
jgi:plastocyanin